MFRFAWGRDSGLGTEEEKRGVWNQCCWWVSITTDFLLFFPLVLQSHLLAPCSILLTFSQCDYWDASNQYAVTDLCVTNTHISHLNHSRSRNLHTSGPKWSLYIFFVSFTDFHSGIMYPVIPLKHPRTFPTNSLPHKSVTVNLRHLRFVGLSFHLSPHVRRQQKTAAWSQCPRGPVRNMFFSGTSTLAPGNAGRLCTAAVGGTETNSPQDKNAIVGVGWRAEVGTSQISWKTFSKSREKSL